MDDIQERQHAGEKTLSERGAEWAFALRAMSLDELRAMARATQFAGTVNRSFESEIRGAGRTVELVPRKED